jgi:hypothetical protein
VGKLRHIATSVPDSWGGVHEDPAGSGDRIGAPRGLVSIYAQRRMAAAAEMAARTQE